MILLISWFFFIRKKGEGRLSKLISKWRNRPVRKPDLGSPPILLGAGARQWKVSLYCMPALLQHRWASPACSCSWNMLSFCSWSLWDMDRAVRSVSAVWADGKCERLRDGKGCKGLSDLCMDIGSLRERWGLVGARTPYLNSRLHSVLRDGTWWWRVQNRTNGLFPMKEKDQIHCPR